MPAMPAFRWPGFWTTTRGRPRRCGGPTARRECWGRSAPMCRATGSWWRLASAIPARAPGSDRRCWPAAPAWLPWSTPPPGWPPPPSWAPGSRWRRSRAWGRVSGWASWRCSTPTPRSATMPWWGAPACWPPTRSPPGTRRWTMRPSWPPMPSSRPAAGWERGPGCRPERWSSTTSPPAGWRRATRRARGPSPRRRPPPRGENEPVNPVAAIFWTAAGLLVYSQAGYPLLLAALAWRRRALAGDQGHGPAAAAAPATPAAGGDAQPFVSIIVAAYAEEPVIARRVENLRALDYPGERVEVIVSCDGSPDRTAELARAAGADVVLERPREGKVRAQDAGVERARGEILAFSDANSLWEADALRALVGAFADPRVGYVCGHVQLINDGGTSQEGLYWRYEMLLRRLESELRSVTGGNGAIYATRRESYLRVDPVMGHDLSFPFNMVKRGWRAVYEPRARAWEKTVPSVEGEFARKRRFMGHTWPIVVRGGMLSPRGYDPLYALMIFSHRLLRYLSPALHLAALASSLRLARPRRRAGPPAESVSPSPPALPGGGGAPAGDAGRGGRGPALARPPTADRPPLRPHHRLGGRGAVGLADPGHASRMGAGGGGQVSRCQTARTPDPRPQPRWPPRRSPGQPQTAARRRSGARSTSRSRCRRWFSAARCWG